MSHRGSDNNRLLEHSRAKIKLLSDYLGVFLAVISNSYSAGRPVFSKVKIFDLFAGEGKYGEDEGSPIQIVRTIQKHCTSYPHLCIPVDFLINEPGKSTLESGRKKIERIRSFVEELSPLPDRLKISYSEKPFEEIFDSVKESLQRMPRNEKALLFIDPWGYKDTRIGHIQAIVETGAEMILFVPVNQIWRFHEKALNDPSFTGGEQIRRLMRELDIEVPEDRIDRPNKETQEEFIQKIARAFEGTISTKSKLYVDYFQINAGEGRLYTLYFFTSNLKGLEKMIEVKWKNDPDFGQGFRSDTAGDLFTPYRQQEFADRVLKYLEQRRSNIDIHDYIIIQERRPVKHISEYLKQWEKDGSIRVERSEKVQRDFHLSKQEELVWVVRK